jgi:hypothetical protein
MISQTENDDMSARMFAFYLHRSSCRGRHATRSMVIGLMSLVCLMGCGDDRPSRVPISGQVLIDGQPLQFGYVKFVPAGGRPSISSLDKEGRFKLACFEDDDGAILGVHRVEVAAGEQLGPTKVRWHAPKKYADFRSSGLQQEITTTSESVVINLSWDGGKPFVEVTYGGGGDLVGDGGTPR